MKSSVTQPTEKLIAVILPVLLLTISCRAPIEKVEIEEEAGKTTPNVVLIVIDTLGAEYTGPQSGKSTITPHVDALARKGALFTKGYSTAPWTIPASASILTGKMPSNHGMIRLGNRLSPQLHSLPKALAAQNYKTAGIVSHLLLDEKWGFSQGFDSYVNLNAHDSHINITSDKVTDRAIQWLETNNRSEEKDGFFLFLHYFDPHYRYRHHEQFDHTSGYTGNLEPSLPIETIREKIPELTPNDVSFLEGLYREEVAFTDHHIGRFLAYLSKSKLDENTLIVLTADHGEEFMRHGWIGHTTTLYEELIHVPVIIAWPEVVQPQTIDAPVSLIDIFPTVTDLLKLPSSGSGMDGMSLADHLKNKTTPPSDRELFFEVDFDDDTKKNLHKSAMRAANLKIIHDKYNRSWQLYDLVADPHEKNNLWKPSDQHQARLQQQLLNWENTFQRNRYQKTTRPDEKIRTNLTAEEIEQLKKLGYL